MWELLFYLGAYLVLQGSPIPEVSHNLTYAYYPVDVKSDQLLLPQLLAASPVREDGRTFVANTTWDVQWTFEWKTDANGVCRITDSSTRLEVVIVLPSLSNASEQQMAVFDRYIAALRQHELNHYKLAATAARKIDGGLKDLPAISSCKALEEYANSMSRRIVEVFNEKSRQYDVDTNHGQTEGAWIDV